MSLAAALEIGKAGLKIYQVANEVVSENIANVNTPGYSRQRVLLESAPPSTANGFPLGTGVRISTVERYYDALVQKQLVNAGTTASYDETKAEVLQQIEPVFNEIAQDGLGASITSFFDSWQDLSLNPTGLAERQAVLARAQIMTDQFHYVDRTLSDTIVAQNDALVPISDDVNRMLNEIAIQNGQIKTTEQVYGNANEMRDHRDYLIRQLSENMGVKYTENTDGTTDVFVTRGAVTVYLVKGTQAGSLSLSAPPANYTVTAHDAVVPATTAVVDNLMYTSTDGGKLWATLQMRDTYLPDYQLKVNTLASAIVTEVNDLHNNVKSATGAYDLVGNAGVDLFLETALTAKNISLSISDPTKLAASKSATNHGDNENALDIADLLYANTMAGATTTFSGYYNALVAQVGLDVQTAQNLTTQDEVFMKQLSAIRDSKSGVSLDEELVTLIQYQKSYQASAKLITTVDEMMNTIINMI